MKEPDYRQTTNDDAVNNLLDLCGIVDICPACRRRVQKMDARKELIKIFKG